MITTTADTADVDLVAPTAQALRVWRRLNLELGEAAIYTVGSDLSDMVGLIAGWYGASPVLRLTTAVEAEAPDTISVVDAAAAIDRINARCSAAPGFAAVDLSGSGHVIGVLLEALPRWGRLMLAAPNPESFTTAFYTDVHRKGVEICSAGELDSIFVDPSGWTFEIERARRLLRHPDCAARLRACTRVNAIDSGAAGV